MDSMLELLRGMRLTSGVFLDAEFSAPWHVVSKVGPEDCRPPAKDEHHIIAYHYICDGTLSVRVEGKEVTQAGPGDIVVVPRNEKHFMGSSLSAAAVSVEHMIKPGTGGEPARLVFGGGGSRTRMLCGFLGHDTPHHPILALLPSVMKIGAANTTGQWIESSFRMAATDIARGKAHSPAMAAKLAELLFMEAVRGYLEARALPDEAPAGSIDDPLIAKALALVQGRATERWTTDALAHECGLSRSAFAARFARALGEPPMRYLARYRLESAATQLRGSTLSVAQIAFDAGYESEAGFNRAFRREYGMPPATWRREQRG